MMTHFFILLVFLGLLLQDIVISNKTNDIWCPICIYLYKWDIFRVKNGLINELFENIIRNASEKERGTDKIICNIYWFGRIFLDNFF